MKNLILPHTAVRDDLYQKAKNSPYYFIADEPLWRCLRSETTKADGKYTEKVMVGSKETDSKQFSKHTPL